MNPDIANVELEDEVRVAPLASEPPVGWAKVQLHEVVQRLTDGTHQPPRFSPNGVPFVVIGNINGSSIDWSSVSKWVSHDTFELEAKRLCPCCDDILYTAVGSYGTAVQLRDDRDFMFQRHIAYLRPDTEVIDPGFLCYALNSPVCKRQADAVARGVAQKTVTLGSLRNFSLPLAPLPEQRRIVARIDELFAEIAEGEAALQRARQGIDTWRSALLKAAVTGELTRDWREANRPTETGADLLARIRAHRGALRRGSGRNHRTIASGTLDIRSLPESWVWAPITELFDIGTGATPKRGEARYYEDGTIPWITSSAVNENIVTKAKQFITKEALMHTNAKLFPIGTIILAMYGEGKTRGKTTELAIVASTNQACAALVPVYNNVLITKYVRFWFEYFYLRLRQRAAGGVQPNLNLEIVRELVLPLPSEDELALIVSRLVEQLTAQDDARELLGRDQAALGQSVLKAAFEGRLVSQDPTDEPAHVLLARLRDGHPGNGARRRRARAKADFLHPSLPGLTRQSVDPRVEPAGDE